MPTNASYVTGLECSKCAKAHDHTVIQNVCTDCGAALLVRYDLAAIGERVPREVLTGRPATLWRYRELLPVADASAVVTLGEAMTHLLAAPRLGGELDVPGLSIKDEGILPTGTFKARGAALGVTRARELGVRTMALPTAGNAGAAWAAYGARAGIPVYVVMPETTPDGIQRETAAYGATVYLIPGSIADAGAVVRRACAERGWFDASTLREPYRIEGKKTMGYELAEQLGWDVPDVIIYPTGGGVGLIGMWKAFAELRSIGWLAQSRRPRFVAVQSEGCAPVVKAFEAGAAETVAWKDPVTFAAGIRVPKALGDHLILRALRESDGTAIAVSDDEIRAAMRQSGVSEGMLLCPEGAAGIAAAGKLRQRGWIRPGESVVVFNTGTGLKYAESLQGDERRSLAAGEQLPTEAGAAA
jgi:threonine synthase